MIPDVFNWSGPGYAVDYLTAAERDDLKFQMLGEIMAQTYKIDLSVGQNLIAIAYIRMGGMFPSSNPWGDLLDSALLVVNCVPTLQQFAESIALMYAIQPRLTYAQAVNAADVLINEVKDAQRRALGRFGWIAGFLFWYFGILDDLRYAVKQVLSQAGYIVGGMLRGIARLLPRRRRPSPPPAPLADTPIHWIDIVDVSIPPEYVETNVAIDRAQNSIRALTGCSEARAARLIAALWVMGMKRTAPSIREVDWAIERLSSGETLDQVEASLGLSVWGDRE